MDVDQENNLKSVVDSSEAVQDQASSKNDEQVDSEKGPKLQINGEMISDDNNS